MNKPFHHVSLLTKDGEQNSEFYTQVLGLRFVKRTVNQDNHRMYHYYYGDYQGTPGTVITFFVVPHLGHRYDNDHYLATIGLKIPKGSLDYWKKRLTTAGRVVTQEENQLFFEDLDGVALILEEVSASVSPELVTLHTDIPAEKQILGIRSTELHVADVEATQKFFAEFLDWQLVDDRIQFNETDYLRIVATEETAVSRMGLGSMDHVAFAVKDEHQLKVLHQRAKEQGWEIEKLISRGYFKSLYIREPGGNRLEFATMAPGFTIDEPLETLGESLALPPFLAKKRQEIEANLYK